MKKLLLCLLLTFLGCAAAQHPTTYQPLHSGNNFDVYYASSTSHSNPAVMLIHGGAWQSGDKVQMEELAHYLNQLGYTAISVNYRLAPTHIWPTQLTDVTDVYNHLINNPTLYNIDSNRISVAGISAGAQLAMMLGYTAAIPPKCIMSFSGETDLTLDPTLVMADYDSIMTNVLGHPRPFSWTELSQMSPIYFSHPQMPLLLVHARHDKNIYSTQADILNSRLTALNGKITYLRLDGDAHSASWKEARSSIANFLNQNSR